MKLKIIILLLVSVTGIGYAQQTEKFFADADVFFKTHVKNGLIDYKAIKENPTLLHDLLETSNEISVSKKDAKTYQAFWINVYNLAVIQGIVDNYPVKSPLDINGFFDQKKFRVGGKKITLNDIENKLLRGNFTDARFHFVLVCAGLGCPPIIDEAYMPKILDKQLDRQTRLALNDDNFIKVNSKKKRVQLSEIMKWYKEDFVRNGNEIDYINQYRDEKIPNNFKISYYNYNWNLNETK